MTDKDEELTKVHVPLPGNRHTGGEALWARQLGGDLFELRNSPFYAYGLNFCDVVRAVPPNPDQKPSVLSIVRPSGHRTIWITFTDERSSQERERLLEELNEWKGYYEGANADYFAIDVEPEGDYTAITNRLSSWQALGILEYHEGEEGGFRPRQSVDD